MRSRRRWETATARNLALLWRLGKRRPEVKTIADFRRDHGAAIRQVCRELTRLGQELDRFGGALIAIDGSTLQAVNGQKRTFSGRKLVRWIEALEAKSAAYLQPLDRHEAEDTPRRTPTAEQMQQTREQWHERKPRDPRDQPQRQPRGETPMSLTAPDRRKITRGDSRLVGYHVQGAVDKQYKLSGGHGVTQAVTDPQQRVPLGERA
jgi:transposase